MISVCILKQGYSPSQPGISDEFLPKPLNEVRRWGLSNPPDQPIVKFGGLDGLSEVTIGGDYMHHVSFGGTRGLGSGILTAPPIRIGFHIRQDKVLTRIGVCRLGLLYCMPCKTAPIDRKSWRRKPQQNLRTEDVDAWKSCSALEHLIILKTHIWSIKGVVSSELFPHVPSNILRRFGI